MTKHTLEFQESTRHNFEAIKNGVKTVETRAGGKGYENIKAGDVLVFKCGSEELEKIVKDIKHFKNVDEMLKVVSSKELGDLNADMEKVYAKYPGYKERIKKFGISAFYI